MALQIQEFDAGKGLVSFVNNLAFGGFPVAVKGKRVAQIGFPDDLLKIYTTIKQIQALINFKSKYVVKDGWFITSQDEEAKKKVEDFFTKINVEEIIENWVKLSMIYGMGYLEFTGDNLVVRDSRRMYLYIDMEGHGVPVAYVQWLGLDPLKYPVFAPDELLVLKNNPIDHLRGLSELIGIDDIVALDNSAMVDLGAALNRQANRRTHYKIGSKEDPIPAGSNKFTSAETAITELQPGEDLITTHDVEAKQIDTAPMGGDFKEYLEMINARMCMQLGVPSDFFFGHTPGHTIEQRKLLFEQAEIMPRRRTIENIINTQLIPQLVDQSKDPVSFKFGDINMEMSFIRSKMQLIELQTGALTPDELRLENGKIPLGQDVAIGMGQADAPTTGRVKQQIPVAAKDETSKGNIGGNLTGARPSNG